MSFFKYHKEMSDADGDSLWWPGGPDGFPFRGSRPPTTTESEYQNLRPSLKFRQKTFYLSNEDDAKHYTKISDKCANGLFIRLDRDRVWDEETKGYRIYLEWVEPAHELPSQPGVKDAIKDYDSKETLTAPLSRLSGIKQSGWW